MTWALRFCGALAAIYLLIVLQASKYNTDAQAATRQSVMRTVTGEMLPVYEAMKVNYLQAYNARHPTFPAVLENSYWVHNLENIDACRKNQSKVWKFSVASDASEGKGSLCKPLRSPDGIRYECEQPALFGGRRVHIYDVKFGDPILPDWALDKPHVTLEREGGLRKKIIGLQMCEG